MPTKMATCCKAVLVTVYVEKPRMRAFSKQSHHHRHHYLHHTIQKEIIQHKHGGAAGKGYNRKAELLHYSQRLRESARSASSTPFQSNPVSSNDQQPSNQIISVQRKPKYSKTPTCFDNWGILIPSFLRCLTNHQAKKPGKKMKNGGSTSSNNKKMKAVMKGLQMQKNWRLIFSKPTSMLRKHR
ncbi:uncharacterized protein LOC111276796 isoform X2 [Durio zibethinus]|uniref:Uncharacterized protein LOC111276796 isoform X2 n=1 Tax=Durio zibethinus TaxID=66656 RepID=A0A6P5WQR7_DURZI|nr:uncharacterized protein LOC111276796 isoform X2 [Durio zibethinus]